MISTVEIEEITILLRKEEAALILILDSLRKM
jgi:hypothetical protein